MLSVRDGGSICCQEPAQSAEKGQGGADRVVAEAGGALTVSVIVPVHNGAASLARCLAALVASDYPHYECIVVDDGSTDDSRAIAARYPVAVVTLAGGPFGPAYARNRASEIARGDILFFVDADVIVSPEAIDQVAQVFRRHPDVDAVFGSYDENPESREFVSQYKNLFHHFVHQGSSEEGSTFWSGCGAIRREVFLKMGGFDEKRYSHPSIEDIDLGCRMRAAGHRILLDKQIQVKHLKRWTLRGMTMSDVFDRGIPWTLLILRERNLPNDLNLRFSQRVSALLSYLLLLDLGLAALSSDVAALPLLAGLFLLAVGSWHWPQGVSPFRTNHRAELLSYLVLGAIVVLAVRLSNLGVLLPLAPLAVGMLAGHWLPHSTRLWNRFFFTIMLMGLVVSLVLVLASLPIWCVVPMLIILGLIALLNYRLYAFFARKRGVLFAAAAFPFQLLYYLYSVLAMAMGTGIYLWNNAVKR